MKAMKLYDGGARIHRELAAQGLSPDVPLQVSQLTPFDQFHYFGTAAVDEAIEALAIESGMRVLDIGAGLGGPARYIAKKTGAHVTALELQKDLCDAGRDLTARCGLSGLVEHRCANVLAGVGGQFDAIVSMLCFLHIPDREKLLSVCRAALRKEGVLYAEDFVRRRKATAAEAHSLATKVQCLYLPSAEEYRQQLEAAGFGNVRLIDVTAEWTVYTAERLAAYRAAGPRNIALHGKEAVEDLEDFFATVAGLFADGAISGVKITAS
jgi:cyclopropane fatty-acyl-phospholipid synthase-like methyltransferase